MRALGSTVAFTTTPLPPPRMAIGDEERVRDRAALADGRDLDRRRTPGSRPRTIASVAPVTRAVGVIEPALTPARLPPWVVAEAALRVSATTRTAPAVKMRLAAVIGGEGAAADERRRRRRCRSA